MDHNTTSHTTNRVFNNTLVFGSSGVSGNLSSLSVGSFDFINYTDNRGARGSGSVHSFGKTKFLDYRDNLGRSFGGSYRKIGRSEFFSGYNGESGWSRQIGSFMFHDFTRSDGTRSSGYTRRIGNTNHTQINAVE